MTALCVFDFAPGSRLWAFTQMGMARPLLMKVPGLRFHRLMGAGRGLGFTLRPDWGRYAFLGVWDEEASAREFLAASPFMARYRSRASGERVLLLRTASARGAWSGMNPFLPAAAPLSGGSGGPVAVLTRATIRPWRAASFWGEVPHVSRRLDGADGLLWSVGVGEAPLVLQATVSVWKDVESMRRFAYHSPEHQRAIDRTRREQWYAEELFARFEVLEQTQSRSR